MGKKARRTFTRATPKRPPQEQNQSCVICQKLVRAAEASPEGYTHHLFLLKDVFNLPFQILEKSCQIQNWYYMCSSCDSKVKKAQQVQQELAAMTNQWYDVKAGLVATYKRSGPTVYNRNFMDEDAKAFNQEIRTFMSQTSFRCDGFADDVQIDEPVSNGDDHGAACDTGISSDQESEDDIVEVNSDGSPITYNPMGSSAPDVVSIERVSRRSSFEHERLMRATPSPVGVEQITTEASDSENIAAGTSSSGSPTEQQVFNGEDTPQQHEDMMETSQETQVRRRSGRRRTPVVPKILPCLELDILRQEQKRRSQSIKSKKNRSAAHGTAATLTKGKRGRKPINPGKPRSNSVPISSETFVVGENIELSEEGYILGNRDPWDGEDLDATQVALRKAARDEQIERWSRQPPVNEDPTPSDTPSSEPSVVQSAPGPSLILIGSSFEAEGDDDTPMVRLTNEDKSNMRQLEIEPEEESGKIKKASIASISCRGQRRRLTDGSQSTAPTKKRRVTSKQNREIED